MSMTQASRIEREKKHKKQRGQDVCGIDRLSNLPVDVIINQIFPLMETIDVVRTCVLSRKWRDLWVSVPCLNFSQHGFERTLGLRTTAMEVTRKFWKFVTVAMVSRDGLPINRLQFSGRCYKELLDLMICLACKGIARELDLWAEVRLDHGPLEIPYVLCESLISLKLGFHHPDEFCVKTKFKSLRRLHLEKVELMDDELTRMLFSSDCISLEELCLQDCFMSELETIDVSAPNLKKFTFVNLLEPTYDDKDSTFFGELKLSTPHLTHFSYTGRVLHKYTLENLGFLENVSFRIFNSGILDRGRHFVFPQMLEGIAHVNDLALSNVFLKYFAQAYDELMFSNVVLHNLKCLKLDFQMVHMRALVNLLKLAHNLETFFIHFQENYDNCPWQFEDIDAASCLLDNLKTVEVSNFSCSTTLLKLLEFLLKNGKVLQKLHIVHESHETMPTGITQKIMSFQKASEEVAISFCQLQTKRGNWFGGQHPTSDSEMDPFSEIEEESISEEDDADAFVDEYIYEFEHYYGDEDDDNQGN